MRGLVLVVLLLVECESECPRSTPMPDAASVADAAVDMTLRMPSDFATGGPDLAGSDMATTCIKCNAVINPCPARGLYCDPRYGCCDTNPH